MTLPRMETSARSWPPPWPGLLKGQPTCPPHLPSPPAALLFFSHGKPARSKLANLQHQSESWQETELSPMAHMKRLSKGEMGQEEILHTMNGVAPSASRPKDIGEGVTS